MSSTLTTLEKFKTNAERFNEVLKALVLKECKSDQTECQRLLALLDAGSMFIKGLRPESLIESFIANSVNYWSKIHHKDKVFFQENLASIFGQSTAISSVLQNVMTKLNSEIEEHLWRWMSTFVKQSLTYLKGKPSKYRRRFINDASFSELCHAYKIA